MLLLGLLLNLMYFSFDALLVIMDQKVVIYQDLVSGGGVLELRSLQITLLAPAAHCCCHFF
jgi:hypothetical protein